MSDITLVVSAPGPTVDLTAVAGTSVTVTVNEGGGGGVSTHAGLSDLATSGHPVSVITGALSAAAAAAAYQPLDADLTAIAALTSPATTITGAVPKSTVTTAGDLIYGTAADTVARLPLGTAAQVLRVDAGATAPEWATVSSGDPTPRRVVLPSSSYYCVPTTISDVDGAFQTSSLAQQAMWWPCYTHRAVTIAALATYCGTLEAGSTMRFGIYANTGTDLAVGSLVADFGTVSGASTGAKEVSGSQAISAGYFWVCNWISNHTTVRWLRRSLASGLPPSFAGVQNAYGRHYMGYKATSVDYSAGLPSSPPALTLMDHVTDTQAAFPYWRFT